MEGMERIEAIKQRAMALVEEGINRSTSDVCIEEVGEAMDIAKDSAEVVKLCAEAKYYESINKAMEETSAQEKMMYMEKYSPEMSFARNYSPYYRDNPEMDYARYYSPMYARRGMYASGMSGGSNSGSSSGSYARGRRYYGEPMHEPWDGDAWKHRRNYMEAKEQQDDDESMKDLEKYMKSLADDILEMIEDASPQEKQILRQKLNTLATKID